MKAAITAREEALGHLLVDIAHLARTASQTLVTAIADEDADAAESARNLVNLVGFIADDAAQQLGESRCQSGDEWLHSPRAAQALGLLRELRRGIDDVRRSDGR